MKEIFKVNDYITLKLENKETYIYINEERFIQCKYLLIEVDSNKEEIDNATSVDNYAYNIKDHDEIFPTDNLYYDFKKEFEFDKSKYRISPETEFWAHCSNLQVWTESNYDTTLIHSNLAFPLLKHLTEVGDPIALRVFKEEIAKRLSSGFVPVMKFLTNEGYLNYLSLE